MPAERSRIDLPRGSFAPVGVETIGPYRVERRLGVSGMTETFSAVREGPGDFVQRVTLKRVMPAFAGDPELNRLFSREARLAAALHHRAVAQVIDFGEADGCMYLAFEHVDGVDLRTLLKASGGPLAPALAVQVALDALEGLEHAHGREPPVVHRDVSPRTVLVSVVGDVKLSDFGLARALNDAERTRSHFLKGNPWYMSPEQVQGGTLDPRSDLFSLGSVLFEMLAGRRAFAAPTDLAAMLAVSKGERPRLSEVADVSESLAAVVERLLEVHPASRFPDAAAAIDALAVMAPPVTARRELGRAVAGAMPSTDAPRTAFLTVEQARAATSPAGHAAPAPAPAGWDPPPGAAGPEAPPGWGAPGVAGDAGAEPRTALQSRSTWSGDSSVPEVDPASGPPLAAEPVMPDEPPTRPMDRASLASQLTGSGNTPDAQRPAEPAPAPPVPGAAAGAQPPGPARQVPPAGAPPADEAPATTLDVPLFSPGGGASGGPPSPAGPAAPVSQAHAGERAHVVGPPRASEPAERPAAKTTEGPGRTAVIALVALVLLTVLAVAAMIYIRYAGEGETPTGSSDPTASEAAGEGGSTAR